MRDRDRYAVQVVLFKRDLRLEDHAPLTEAAARGPVLPLYVVEPSMVQDPIFDARHWTFIRASLIDLRRRCSAVGQPLVVRTGEVVEVLGALHAEIPIARLWAHQETGDRRSFARDRAVRTWARAHGVRFTERPSNGVVRGRYEPKQWKGRWLAQVEPQLVAPPDLLQSVPGLDPGAIPDHADLGLSPGPYADSLRGGEAVAQRALRIFLDFQADRYGQPLRDGAMAGEASSRLSPHLTWGNLSVRQLVHAARDRSRTVRLTAGLDPDEWRPGLTAFESKLMTRSRLVQRLEDRPEIESGAIASRLGELGPAPGNGVWFDAWTAGATGYPLVDAAMRALGATGWLPFTLRAVLASFACNDLWLPWQEVGRHLARLQLDTEPGILWSQLQLQAGTTGDRPRIYDPTRQARALDPDGRFIRHWVPELEHVPDAVIHTPWQMADEAQRQAACAIGHDYPAPIVDHAIAARAARTRFAAAIEQDAGRIAPKPDNPPLPTQLSLPLD